MWSLRINRISAANYYFASELNKRICQIVYTVQHFFFFMSEPFFKESYCCQLVFCSLILDRDTSTPHAISIPCLNWLSSLSFSRNSYYIPLLFYDVGQHLKKQNLIFRTIYTFSHYLNVFNIFSVILRLVMKSWA